MQRIAGGFGGAFDATPELRRKGNDRIHVLDGESELVHREADKVGAVPDRYEFQGEAVKGPEVGRQAVGVVRLEREPESPGIELQHRIHVMHPEGDGPQRLPHRRGTPPSGDNAEHGDSQRVSDGRPGAGTERHGDAS